MPSSLLTRVSLSMVDKDIHYKRSNVRSDFAATQFLIGSFCNDYDQPYALTPLGISLLRMPVTYPLDRQTLVASCQAASDLKRLRTLYASTMDSCNRNAVAGNNEAVLEEEKTLDALFFATKAILRRFHLSAPFASWIEVNQLVESWETEAQVHDQIRLKIIIYADMESQGVFRGGGSVLCHHGIGYIFAFSDEDVQCELRAVYRSGLPLATLLDLNTEFLAGAGIGDDD
jgi:hypothetical protein